MCRKVTIFRGVLLDRHISHEISTTYNTCRYTLRYQGPTFHGAQIIAIRKVKRAKPAERCMLIPWRLLCAGRVKSALHWGKPGHLQVNWILQQVCRRSETRRRPIAAIICRTGMIWVCQGCHLWRVQQSGPWICTPPHMKSYSGQINTN